MSRLNQIVADEATEELQQVLTEPGFKFGNKKGFLKILIRSAPTLRAYARAEDALENGRLSQEQRQQIAHAVAETNGVVYGLSGVLNASPTCGQMEWPNQHPARDRKDVAMLRFVRAVVLLRGKVDAKDYAAVRDAGFSEAEIIEILGNIALSIFTNYLTIVEQPQAGFPSVRLEDENKRKGALTEAGADREGLMAVWILTAAAIALTLVAGYLLWAKVSFHWPF